MQGRGSSFLKLIYLAGSGEQITKDKDVLDQLTEHKDRLATSLRSFAAASGSEVLVRSDTFESYSKYLLQLQQVKVCLVQYSQNPVETAEETGVLYFWYKIFLNTSLAFGCLLNQRRL